GGNLLGSLFCAFFFFLHSESLGPEGETALINLVEHKAGGTSGGFMVRAIACNVLVCLAVWMAYSARDTTGKIVSMWLPIFTFVYLGFEHSVADMSLIPAGMLFGADVSFSRLLERLVLATLGNAFGGVLFVGGIYAAIYRRDLH
ncbi:MAG: hypothetical protein MHM6MM_009650, partial [Cercozoa sp. M6MM]